MNKIVYLIEQPLDQWNCDRFGVQSWIDKGWEVEVWDFTPLSYPDVWKNFFKTGQKLKELKGYYPFTSQSVLRNVCSRAGEVDFFIDFAGNDYFSVKTKMRLVRNGAVRIVCDGGSIPEAHTDITKCGFVCKIKKAIAKGFIKSFRWMIDTLARKVVGPFIRPGLAIVSGEKACLAFSRAYPSIEIIKAHNFDYDNYLKLSKSSRVPDKEYAVFLDQDCCFHPDFLYLETVSVATPKNYFPAVCAGLRKIANSLGVEPLVAAHPRSSYQLQGVDYFEGIPLEYGRTAELIRDSKVVVCHDSTAVQFGALFEKPVIFFTTDELNSTVWGASIAEFALEFGKSPINVNGDIDSVDWQNELTVNHDAYARYREKFIKTKESPRLPLWNIVIDHIEKKISNSI